mgnify:FL=1
MKKMWGTRVLAMLLVLALTAGLVPAALAANSEASVAFKQVPNDTLDTLIRPDVAVGEIEDAEMGEDTAAYQAHDLVRVSIILEDASTLEAYSDAAAEGTLAEDAAAVSYRAALQRKQDSVVRKISSTILGREDLDVVWNLTLVANMISANVEYGKIEQIKQIPGVADVVLEQQYEPAASENTVQPNMEISTGMTGTTTAWSTGYTGAGMRIAIIDTGLDTSHQSFDNGAYEYALEQNAARAKESVEAYKASLDLLDADEINEKLSLLHIKEGVSAADLYRTEKVAYGYCYIDKDLDVTHETDTEGEHGSHVAGIAAANRYLPDGNGGYVSALESVHMHGAAPDAQVLVMKVFGDEGGAYDSDYTAAIEDAIVLGADTINLSLGSASPGPSKARTEAYQKIFDDLANASSVVTVSSGNANYWAKNADPIGYLYSDGVSMQTDGQPGSYANSLTVASVDNDGFIGNYLLIGQDPIAPSETTGFTNKPISTIVGEHEFVFFSEEATKYAVDAAGNNLLLAYADAVKGKIVFVSRGQSSFYQKHDAAAAAGALACVVYNNQSGSINMDLSGSTATIPCVSITQDDGELVRTQAEPVYAEDGTTVLYYTGKIEVRGKEPVRFNRDYKTISEFSSWGVPGDLTLKPEIAAPGGNIYSLNGLHNSTSGMQGGHQDYELMSGTSMAAPQIAGIGALVKQYIESKGLSRSDLTDRALAQSIMMSTAEPVVNNENDAYYPVIQQGAGMVNAAAATSADSYIKMQADATASWADGKVKAELGDDPARTGSYDFSFTVNNLDGRTHAYALSAELFTQALFDYEGQSYMDTLTTPLNAAVTWTVNGRATDSLSRDYDYNNDGRVDLEDGQLLLDVASKKPGAKLLNTKAIADLNGDGAVTAYDAHLFLNLLQEATILVPANGKAEVVCHIRLLDRSTLNASYSTGAYVEGYVRVQGLATDEGAAGTSHSIPVLGYYGSWSEPSMYDVGSLIDSIYGTETRAPYLGTTNSYGYTVSNFLNILYAGETESSVMVGNPVDFDDEYLSVRNAFNNQGGNSISTLVFSLIRNAGNSRLQIVDSNTKIAYLDEEVGAATASYYSENANAWQHTRLQLGIDWSGTDASGNALPEGTSVDLTLTMAPEYYANADGSYRWDELKDGAKLSTHLTIDNTAPELVFVRQDLTQKTLAVTAMDNRYVAAVILWNMTDTPTPVSYILPNQPENALGKTTDCTFDLSKLSGGEKLLLQVVDYAYNASAYQLISGEEPAEALTSVTLSPESVSLLAGSNYTLEASTEPYYADDKLDWTSSAPAVVTVNNNGQIKAVSAGTATITAASHKNPEVHASCTVQVLAPNYTFRGLLTADNQVQTFEWNLADSETWEKVAAVDGIGSRVTSAGASSANGIYAFDVDGSAYEIDFATGKILNTGSAPFSDESGPVAYDDIALSRKYTGTESLHGDLLTGVYSMNIIPMQDPMNGSASSYISVYDLFGYDADGFSGITSLGSITFKDPDSGEDVDAEAYYVIDNAGGIWQLMIYPQDGDYYAAYQYIPTDLGFQFPYDPNWATLCSLNVADDGELFLTSYSTQGKGASRKESTTLYWLHYDEQANRFRTAIIGSFGDIAPVSVTEVHTNDSTADTQKTSVFEKALRPEALKTAKAQPISQMKAANKQTAGTLNSVSQPQSTGSTSAQRSTVTLDLTAIAPTASSIMEISYNTKELTLSSVTGAATLTSWYESVPGTIVFACAERSEAAVGELLGQLRFELAAGSSSSKVTIKTKQLNETSFAAGQEKIRTVVLGDSLSPILPAIISSGEKDCPSRSFRDLDTTKWYHEAIDTMLREGLMNGTGNGLFEPNGTLTRAMLVTILWRSEGKPVASAQTSFTDVPAGAYYAEAVRWAAANGVVKGVSSTEFGPSKNITRQELVTILWRLAAKKGLNTSNAGLTVPEFTDRSQIAAWAAEAMSWGCTRGILTGKSANRVDPTGTATRAEAAAMIVRFRNLGTAGEKQ